MDDYKGKNCSIFSIDIAMFMETAMITQRYLVRSLEECGENED